MLKVSLTIEDRRYYDAFFRMDLEAEARGAACGNETDSARLT